MYLRKTTDIMPISVIKLQWEKYLNQLSFIHQHKYIQTRDYHDHILKSIRSLFFLCEAEKK